ncbi:hypothetical protein BJY01DRAFT_245090 [Aspergillus pseudoustus]|uniref:Fungal-type protein kinase domain-containing protein n=1 Tax=Aspergillus pseudoustus TaxID=1810923 RepID=A0ABR4KFU0_9EURO
MVRLNQSGMHVASWEGVMFIGALVPATSSSYRTGLLTLCRYARTVFAAQPVRFFVHGGEALDLAQQSAERFATILASYMLMNDAQLGVRDSIKKDNHSPYVECDGGPNSKTERQRLSLDSPQYLPG